MKSFYSIYRSCFCHIHSIVSWVLALVRNSITSMLWMASRIKAFSFNSRTTKPTSGSADVISTLVYASSCCFISRWKEESELLRMASSQRMVNCTISPRHNIYRDKVTTHVVWRNTNILTKWRWCYISVKGNWGWPVDGYLLGSKPPVLLASLIHSLSSSLRVSFISSDRRCNHT